ncbi:pentatricopeptide repeat-containing protein At4g32430, mitochondrial [Salvia hispanica]|uniref:pentatricopeptide repeat-containing protein At4g32430, mitochondrial n=1 Tax=Salvia hispanica TaxID=49212 RepID=UPI002009005D|nr:pentatricopeptide repeat-containing protein At4g32430, mitochondrial [Salvia hispanica]
MKNIILIPQLQILQKQFIHRPICFNTFSSYSYYHAQHMLDEMPQRPNVPVYRFMLNLMNQNRRCEALYVFKKHLRTDISGVNEVVLALASKACVGHPRIGRQTHGFAVVSGFIASVSVCNSLMNMYCKSSNLRTALCIFVNLKNPDSVSYNTVLSGFEDNKSALLFARGMHSSGIAFDSRTFTSALAHCADGEEFDLGFQLHCLVSKLGLEAENFTGNALITLYSKCGKVEDAKRVFNEMPHKDLVSWNAILSGYAQEGSNGLGCIKGFVEMVMEGFRLDHVSFTSVVAACGHERNLEFGKQVHALSVKRGYGDHVKVCNVLMSMYSKCEAVGDAVSVFENIVDRNVVSWTTMISIDEEHAMNLFKEMIQDEVWPNDVTFIGLIHAITKHNMMREGLMVHAFCMKSNFLSETSVANSFITMYGKFQIIEDCIKVFELIDERDIISWNALISAYSLNGMYQEALQVFSSASKELTPNPYTFGAVLHAIASSESISLRQGQRCHGFLKKLGLDIDPIVSGALLDMYAKRGSIFESEKIFSELTEKNQVAWTAIISAYSRHGDYEKVMKYFKEMEMEGVKPDSITFLSILTACSRNGMVDVGREVFDSMICGHSVEPSAEHYSCIVDMLGRAGKLKEAEDLLSQIPGGPGVSVLQSLLGACRIYGDVEMATRVADTLIEMEPDESGSYVLMSNLFAEKGKWEKVAKIRIMMRQRKVIKEVGFSWADVGNIESSLGLHGFSSGDKSHRRSKEIYEMADLLGSEMKRRARCYEICI